MPKRWRCFHCDQTFNTKGTAAVHFGKLSNATPLCTLSERYHHLGIYIRKLESELSDYKNEGGDILRAMYAQQHETETMLREAEEQGFMRGIEQTRDMLQTLNDMLDRLNQGLGKCQGLSLFVSSVCVTCGM